MSRLSKNVIYNFCGQGLLLVFGLVAVKYIFKQLGEDVLGIIYFTAIVNTLLAAVLRKGVFSTVVREISGHYQSDKKYVIKFVRTTSFITWSSYFFFSVLIYFGAPVVVEKWIRLSSMNVGEAITAFRVLGISSLLAIPEQYYSSLFRGLQRMEFNNSIAVGATAIRQFGIVVILMQGGNLYHVIYWIAGSYFFWVLVDLFFSNRFFSVQALVPGFFPDVIKRNRDYGLKMTYVSLLAIVHRQADKLFLSVLLPIGVLGYYSSASSLVSKAGTITGSVAGAAFPSFCELFKDRDDEGLKSRYQLLQDFICFIMLPVFVFILFAALPLFTYIFTPEIAKSLIVPVGFLSLGFYMNSTLNLPFQVSKAVGKPEIAIRSSVYALFVVLPITLLLIKRYGITGAALSWVVYNGFVYLYAIPRICSECLRIPVKEWYKRVLKIYLIGCISYGLAGWFLLKILEDQSIQNFILGYSGGSVIYLLGAFFVISDKLKERIFNSFRRKEASRMGQEVK